MCFTHDDLGWIVALFDPAAQDGIDLMVARSRPFQYLAVVVGSVSAGTVAPEEGIYVAFLERPEDILDKGVDASFGIHKDTIPVAVKNHTIGFTAHVLRRR